MNRELIEAVLLQIRQEKPFSRLKIPGSNHVGSSPTRPTLRKKRLYRLLFSLKSEITDPTFVMNLPDRSQKGFEEYQRKRRDHWNNVALSLYPPGKAGEVFITLGLQKSFNILFPKIKKCWKSAAEKLVC